MSNETLEKMITDFLKLDMPVSSFAWQGGEPTLMGLDFYKKAVELQQTIGKNGQAVSNALQTNAVLLDANWCRFLSQYEWLVGISLDGPKHLHDHYRLGHAGNPTFDKVVSAIEKCRQHKVQFNVLVLLNDRNVTAPDELFDFFTGMNIRYLQFVPCVETGPSAGSVTDFSITPEQFGTFLCRIFDRWTEYGPEKLSIRILDSIMSYFVRGRHSNCSFSNSCNDYIVIEHNGDAFCCDFFVDEDCRLGSILDTDIGELAQGKTKRSFARQKSRISNKCLICRHNAICRGGCLKDRLILNGNSSDPSYFCRAYKQFFDHSLARLTQIAAKIAAK